MMAYAELVKWYLWSCPECETENCEETKREYVVCRSCGMEFEVSGVIDHENGGDW